MRILIISLQAGEGHVKAAEALEQAFRVKYPFVHVKRVDFFEYSSKMIKKLYGDLYLVAAKHTPHLHNFLYETLQLIKNKQASYGRIFFDTLNAKPLLHLIDEFHPDVIVCTHPVPASVVRTHASQIPLVVTVTDYELHRLWIETLADLYIVACPEIKKKMVEEGVPPDRVYVLGIPLRLDFAKNTEKKAARRALGVADIFTVFVLAGSFGSSPAEKILRLLSAISRPFQVLVVTGRNQELFSLVEEIKPSLSFPVHLFGFTDKIAELMAASDVLISKPGGVTVTEALAKNLPMIMIKGFAGQEEANARYMVRNGCAVRAQAIQEIPALVLKMMSEPSVLRDLRKSIGLLARPRSSFDAAALIWKKFLACGIVKE